MYFRTEFLKRRKPQPEQACCFSWICRVAFLFLLAAANGASALEAGAAKVDITAPIGTPLSGYGARMGRDSTGVHDPIWSRTLFLDDGNTRLFWVSVDLVAINPELRARVLELAPAAVPPENIILSATHTHNGHGGMSRNIFMRFVTGRFIPEVLDQTAAGIAASMKNAYNKRRRAAMGYAVGVHEGLSANRRYKDGPIDEQMGVLLVEDADGNPISILTNFAGHPTSIGEPDTYLFSADYPGFYYLEMEALMGHECIPIFLNGAEGNQTIGNPEKKSGWERTESVGRLIARRAHEIAQNISYTDTTLKLIHKMAVLPRTLGETLMPNEVMLQSLEINDLLISFFPGEPCVELGLTLRKLALARGYGAHFSVGLSNDYLMYFVPRHLYGDLTYESVMTFFGPGIEDWFYEQFQDMMQLPAAASEQTAEKPDPAITETEIEGGRLVTVRGTSFQAGRLRGERFAADMVALYRERVIEPLEQGVLVPDSGMWGLMPGFLNVPALALPLLGMGSRNLLKGLSSELLWEMEGMAAGAGLPFDGLWLLQNAPLYAGFPDKSPLYAAPICTMFAVTGERAGAEGLMVGRNLDWELSEDAVITRIIPDDGHAFVQAGFSWNAGVFTAVNDDGLVVCVERLRPCTAALPAQALPEYVLRDLIQRIGGFTEAVDLLKTFDYITDMHVLVAGFDEGKPRAAVVELGPEPVVRYDEFGILLGVSPDDKNIPETTRVRYSGLKKHLDSQPEERIEDLQQLLTGNGLPASDGMQHIWNSRTHHSAVLLPSSRKMYIAFPEDSGIAGQFTEVTVSGDGQ